MPQVSDVAVEDVAINCLELGHLRLYLGLMFVGGYKRPFELVMNLVSRRVAVGIWSRPAVVLNGCMQRLGRVAHIVAQPPGIKDGHLLHGARVLARRRQASVLA